MIEEEFNPNALTSVDFGVALKSTGERYLVPANDEVQHALSQILSATVDMFRRIDDDWQSFDLTEDYGMPRKVYVSRETVKMDLLSSLFEADTFDDIVDVMRQAQDVDYYFASFRDSSGKKIIGVRKAVQLKASLKARGRIVRWFDNTLQLVEDDVLKLDSDFDMLVADQRIYILRPVAFEQVAQVTRRVTSLASARLDVLKDAIGFLDLSGLMSTINRKIRSARSPTHKLIPAGADF